MNAHKAIAASVMRALFISYDNKTFGRIGPERGPLTPDVPVGSEYRSLRLDVLWASGGLEDLRWDASVEVTARPGRNSTDL